MTSSVWVIVEHYMDGDGNPSEFLHNENAYATRDSAIERINELIATDRYRGYTLAQYEVEDFNKHEITAGDDVWANFNVGSYRRNYLSLRQLIVK